MEAPGLNLTGTSGQEVDEGLCLGLVVELVSSNGGPKTSRCRHYGWLKDDACKTCGDPGQESGARIGDGRVGNDNPEARSALGREFDALR